MLLLIKLTDDFSNNIYTIENPSSMKKKIGISFSETNFRYYWNWFTKDELQDTELISLSFLENNWDDFHTCDGFILTGGVDVHPSLYGGNLKYENKPRTFRLERDRFEENMYKHSQENNKPLLGICRGLQLVNVLQGGKLIQDIDTEGNAKHCDFRGKDKKHVIDIEKESLLHSIALSDKIFVNSAHHQAIDPVAIGDNLVVNAYDDCEEKLIEGVEFKDKTNKAFMLCVQWHPERMKDADSILSKKIKESFLEAVAPCP